MENIFICLAAPLLIAVFLLKGETRRFIVFFTLGLSVCLLSAYINDFIATAVSVNGEASLTVKQSMVQITPVCEEIMKALPVFFYIAVFDPKRDGIVAASLATGLGFATFENCCYIINYGASDFWFVLIRGFSAGVLHAVCAAVLGYGLTLIYRRERLAAPGAFALLCVTITFHAVYNLLVLAEGGWRGIGYALPMLSAGVALLWIRKTKTGTE